MIAIRIAILFLVAFLAKPTFGAEESKSNWGTIYPTIALTSDYRFNGVSQSNREPAFQGNLHWIHPSNFYGGVFISQVDFQDPGNTSVEVDTYIGQNFYRGNSTFKIEVMNTSFDDDVPGVPSYDFWQFKLGAEQKLGDTSVGITAQWSPEGSVQSGNNYKLTSTISYELTESLNASALLGRRFAERGINRFYWDAGLTYDWKKLSLDIRYFDTDLERQQCFFTDWCGGSIVSKITFRFN